jgi:hypothetical protein
MHGGCLVPVFGSWGKYANTVPVFGFSVPGISAWARPTRIRGTVRRDY